MLEKTLPAVISLLTQGKAEVAVVMMVAGYHGISPTVGHHTQQLECYMLKGKITKRPIDLNASHVTVEKTDF